MSSVCIRLGFSCNARTFARTKKLINSKSLPNYKYNLITSPVEKQNDLELDFKVFFFVDS